MATNGAHDVEDAEMAECDGEKVVTMMDVLQEEQDFEDDANAVLGASDEKNCTYTKGYIKRQAIYACLTCCSEAKDDPTKRAGVCLACSLNCHENHELVELYTKRNFRCDCGNPKFNSHPCQFTPDKNDLNDENSYNQNFSGLYCNCHRPYPDPEATIEDEEMIQCIICEDWLHASHLDAIVPANDQYTEMVCKDCMEKNEFLHDYSSLAVNVESEDVDVITNNSNNTNVSNRDLETKKIFNGIEETAEDITEEHKTEMDTNTKNTDLCNGDLETEKLLNGTGETSEGTTEEPNSDMDTNSKNTNLSDEDLGTEKLLNGTDETPDDTTEELTSNMDNSVTDNTETMENLEVEKPEENITTEPIDETKKAENIEKPISSVVNSNDNEETESPVTLEAKSKDIDDSLKTPAPEDKNIIQQDLNETATGNSEESKDITEPPQEPQDSKEVKETSDQDTPATETSEESPYKNTETFEAKKEISSEKETDNLEPNEVTDKIIEHTSEDDKGEEVNKVDSEDFNDKQAEVMQTIGENVVITDDNKAPSTENESKSNFTDIEMSEVTREPETENTAETKEDNTNKTDNAETGIPADESTPKTEMSDSLSHVESPETTPKDVNSDELPKNTDEINKEYSMNTDEENNINTDEENKENNLNADEENKENNINTDEENKENKRKLSTEDITEDICVKKPKLDDENKCTRPKSVRRLHTGATFWPSNFRQKLCTCSECISMYKELSVLFLTDPEDTVFAYETLGKERVHGRATQYEKGLEALSSLGRIQQINALTEYNKMKDKLLDFLKSFKDRKEIVKEDDIKEFFAGMKPKREPDGVYFCR